MGNNEVGEMWNSADSSGDFTVGHTDMKTSPFYGIGIGVEHNRWLRFDITGEYRGKYLLDRHGTTTAVRAQARVAVRIRSPRILKAGSVTSPTPYRLHVTGVELMPYVGGGIGIASVSVLGLEDVTFPQNGGPTGRDHK